MEGFRPNNMAGHFEVNCHRWESAWFVVKKKLESVPSVQSLKVIKTRQWAGIQEAKPVPRRTMSVQRRSQRKWTMRISNSTRKPLLA